MVPEECYVDGFMPPSPTPAAGRGVVTHQRHQSNLWLLHNEDILNVHTWERHDPMCTRSQCSALFQTAQRIGGMSAGVNVAGFNVQGI